MPSGKRQQTGTDNQAHSTTCQICYGKGSSFFSQDGFHILQCQACGHQFLDIAASCDHVSSIYGDAYFNGGGNGYPNYLGQERIIRQYGRYYANILHKHTQPGTLFDVGAASGFVMKGFRDCGWQVAGVEPNDSMAKHGRQSGLHIHTGTLEACPRENSFDVISFIQVLPHVYDLRKALDAALSITAPGGFWLIETWNRASLSARLLKQHWHEYSPPSVLRWFSPADLEQLADSYGFARVDEGRPRKRVLASHGKSLVEHKARNMGIAGKVLSGLAGIIPDNAVLPYPSEDLFWALYKRR